MSSNLLKEFIRRNLQEIDMGKSAFDPARRKPLFDPPEPNTPSEQELEKTLIRWLRKGGRQFTFSASEIADIRSLMSDPKWSAQFHEPNVDEVYRGIALPINKLSLWTGLSPIQVNLVMPKGEIRAKKKAPTDRPASWTKNEKIAWMFAVGASTSTTGLIPVVLYARVSDNPGVFFDIADMLSDMKRQEVDPETGALTSGLVDMSEAEVVSLAPTTTYMYRWVNPRHAKDELLADDAMQMFAGEGK